MTTFLAQSFATKMFLMTHVPVGVFIFCFGACVGSFLNVVIFRLPAGMSVVSPPSRCPTCGARLKFFGDNLPILGYLLVRGKCRYCGVKFSPQYMFVELLMAMLFVAVYVSLFIISPNTPGFAGGFGSQWWFVNGPFRSGPAFIALLFLLAGLVAMNAIDARSFTIPIQIPVFVTVVAFIAYPVQALMPLRNRVVPDWAIPTLDWTGVGIAVGGMAGVLLSFILLKTGRLRYSFSDYDDYLPPPEGGGGLKTDRMTAFELLAFHPILIGLLVFAVAGPWWGLGAGGALLLIVIVAGIRKGELLGGDAEPTGEDVLAEDYPHTRREMGVELVYVLPCIVGVIGGWLLSRGLGPMPPPYWLQALAGSFAGYLMGGALIWGIRILGSLAVGREAMGIGDVHLLAAVGAVLGWFDPILIFFLAPFSGLLWFVLSKGLSTVMHKRWNELPYGPHLAIATLVVILARPALHAGWQGLFPMIPWPEAVLHHPPVAPAPAQPAPTPVP